MSGYDAPANASPAGQKRLRDYWGVIGAIALFWLFVGYLTTERTGDTAYDVGGMIGTALGGFALASLGLLLMRRQPAKNRLAALGIFSCVIGLALLSGAAHDKGWFRETLKPGEVYEDLSEPRRRVVVVEDNTCKELKPMRRDWGEFAEGLEGETYCVVVKQGERYSIWGRDYFDRRFRRLE